jgi:hypothetical protein
MKDKEIVLTTVFAVAFLAAFFMFIIPKFTSASTSLLSVADQTVYVGDTVTVEVVGERTKTGFPANDFFNTTNDWQSTEIDGTCYNTPDLILGTGTATTSYQLAASTTDAATTSQHTVKVFRFDGCDDNFFLAGQPHEDMATFTLEVQEVPVPSTGSSSSSSNSGGGSFLQPCYYLTRSYGVPMCPTPEWAWELWRTDEGKAWFRSLPY